MSRTTRWGSFLTDIEAFDSEFFDIAPSEADKMDPQQRLLLEVAYEAMEHAGIPARSRCGTVADGRLRRRVRRRVRLPGDLRPEPGRRLVGHWRRAEHHRQPGFLLLRPARPSVTVDTACSSSLVAIHLACQSLRTGESILALAGGVNLILSPAITRSFDRAEAMSPTGRCPRIRCPRRRLRPRRGLRRGGAQAALRCPARRRPRLAVMRGSAVNQDGRSNGLMAPNPAAQMAVLRAAYCARGSHPRDVDYVETHGTGTLLGDPIEARALGTVLGRDARQDEPLLIGAVKSNLGHLEAAAGIAGFIKAVLAGAARDSFLPIRGFGRLRTRTSRSTSLRLKVIAELTDWPDVRRPRRAGRARPSGSAGTNAHVVHRRAAGITAVDGRPGRGSETADARSSTLVVSGKTAERIAVDGRDLWPTGWTDDGSEVALTDVAHTLDHHRARHPQVRDGRRHRPVAGDRRTACGGGRSAGSRCGRAARGGVPSGDGVRLLGSGLAMGRNVSSAAFRRTGLCRGRRCD